MHSERKKLLLEYIDLIADVFEENPKTSSRGAEGGGGLSRPIKDVQEGVESDQNWMNVDRGRRV